MIEVDGENRSEEDEEEEEAGREAEREVEEGSDCRVLSAMPSRWVKLAELDSKSDSNIIKKTTKKIKKGKIKS